MSGKVIMKRKREEKFTSCISVVQNDNSLEEAANEDSCDSSKRSRVATNQSTSNSPPTPTVPQPAPRNELLVEALQRIVELQNELDAFERDLDDDDRYQLPNYGDDSNVSMYQDEELGPEEQSTHEEQEQSHDLQRSEAEALGFAMCARETLLFLEREGIPTDSLLYKSLRSKLVGQADGLIPI